MRKDANRSRVPYHCECPDCLRHPHEPTAQEHQSINCLVAKADELSRRLFVGFLAQQHGHGGIALLHRITGLDRNTIARGLRELRQGDDLTPGRVRHPGAGRKKAEVKFPGS
jgi:hypothetical protein